MWFMLSLVPREMVSLSFDQWRHPQDASPLSLSRSFSVGLNKEQMKLLKINGDRFICPTCRGKKALLVLNRHPQRVFPSLGTLPVCKSSSPEVPTPSVPIPEKSIKTTRKSTVRDLQRKRAKPKPTCPDVPSTVSINVAFWLLRITLW